MVAHNRSMYPELAFNSLAAQAGLELLILLHLLPAEYRLPKPKH